MTVDPAAGIPPAYLSGSAGFFRREFIVTPDVLIPRPETELLVEDAIEFLHASGRTAVLDVGTGSGAIACTIAAELPHAFVDATDISAEALAVARRNALELGVADRCRFVQADIVATEPATYDLIAANLPYIPTNDVPAKPNPVGFEPRIATDGGPDGLEQYRKLLAVAPRLLRPGGLVLLEGAPPTMAAFRELAGAAFPLAAITVVKDYARLYRYLRIAVPMGT